MKTSIVPVINIESDTIDNFVLNGNPMQETARLTERDILNTSGSSALYILGITSAILALGVYIMGALAVITSTITAIGVLYTLKN